MFTHSSNPFLPMDNSSHTAVIAAHERYELPVPCNEEEAPEDNEQRDAKRPKLDHNSHDNQDYVTTLPQNCQSVPYICMMLDNIINLSRVIDQVSASHYNKDMQDVINDHMSTINNICVYIQSEIINSSGINTESEAHIMHEDAATTNYSASEEQSNGMLPTTIVGESDY